MSKAKWKSTRLGDLISIKHGWPFKSEQFFEELTGLPIVVAVGNFQYTGGFRFDSTATKEYRGSYPPEYLLEPDDILLVMTCQTAGGEILGIPARIPNDERQYLHNQRLGKVVLRADAPVDLNFLYWVFLSKPFNQELCASASGTKIIHTAPKRIEAYEIDLPPLPEQRAIANILGTLDDKIELNRRRNRTLEGLARALFQSWFVDFDPVHAKAAGHTPPGLSPALAALFPDLFEDSELGEIPKGWRVDTIGDVAEIVGGSTPSTKQPSYWDDGVHHWATPKDLSNLANPVLLQTDRKITDAGLEKISSGLLPAGTVLLSSRAPIGYLAINRVPVAINQGFIAMKPKASMPAQFLLRWAEMSHDTIVSRANGSTFLEISKKNFRPIQLVIPDDNLLAAFDENCSPLFDQVVTNERESRTLAALRDALLPKLISGELWVPEAERIVGRAV